MASNAFGVDVSSLLGLGSTNSGPKAENYIQSGPAGEYSGYYQAFYDQFLRTANSLPINSMWLLKFDIPPTPGIMNAFPDITYGSNINKLTTAWGTSESFTNNSKGVMLAQGVKVVGETNNIVRVGTKNTGYVQGLISNGREGFPLLDVSFMENNVSFVDYFLRPWCVAVTNHSLKASGVKTNIDIIFLSKMGVGEPLQERKGIRYVGCCPVSINTEEYNYQGSDVYRLRQVQFAYSYYELIPVSDVLLGIMNTSNLIEKIINDSKPMESMNSVVKFAKDIFTGTVNNIITNTVGTIDNQINKAITTVTSTIRGAANDITNSINDVVNKAIGDSTVISSGNSPLKYTEKSISSNDMLLHPENRINVLKSKPAIVDVNKIISQNDTPNFRDLPVIIKEINKDDSSDGQTVVSANISINQDDFVGMVTPLNMIKKPNPPINDVRHGEINTEHVVKNINQKDYVTSLQVDNSGKAINQNDVPNKNDIKFIVKSINPDDVPKFNK